ncbi:hypothetical protein J7E62_27205 [Variovorax paradoxus]|nr:hypothetical protein [Variovorax paradoxus]
MPQDKRRAGLALTGVCLAALAATGGASLFAAERDGASFMQAHAREQPAAGGTQGNDPGSASLGGALYSPFSTAEMVAERPGATHVTPTRHKEDEARPGLAMTAVTAFVAAGFLVALVRALIEL